MITDAIQEVTHIREATRNTPFEGRLYLVGGCVRDTILGNPTSDYDFVLEDDAFAVPRLLWERGIADHPPIEFPNFGTAMVHVGGISMEFVRARAETYRQGSRKPIVTPGTLQTDAERRDFTCNTLMQNLHTGEILDLTGCGRADLEAGVLRTPLDPIITFTDDPLRMLRACRFAAKLGFSIAPETWQGICENAFRLAPQYGIAFERIKEELSKMLMAGGRRVGLELLRTSGLLPQFAPELVAVRDWSVVEALPENTALEVRLAALLLAVPTARDFLARLRFPNDVIEHVGNLVDLRGSYGEYNEMWKEAEVRRLMRRVGIYRADLFALARACGENMDALSARMVAVDAKVNVTELTSPLSGQEIMALLRVPAGRLVGQIKDALTEAVVLGELDADDKEGAAARAREMARAAG